MACNVVPCSESFWLQGAILDHIERKVRVSRDDLCKVFTLVDESLIINELKCLKANGKIRALYIDMTCFFEIA